MGHKLNLSSFPFDSVLESLNDGDVKTLTCVNNAIRKNIIDIPTYRNRIGYLSITQFMNYHTDVRREYYVVNGRYTKSTSYKSLYELFENSVCKEDGFVDVYVPLFPITEIPDHDIKMLQQSHNIKPFLQVPRDEVGCKTILSSHDISVMIKHRNIMIPLVDLSQKCILRSEKLLSLGKILYVHPVLKFTLKHTNYMDVIKYITAEECDNK